MGCDRGSESRNGNEADLAVLQHPGTARRQFEQTLAVPRPRTVRPAPKGGCPWLSRVGPNMSERLFPGGLQDGRHDHAVDRNVRDVDLIDYH